MAMLALPVFAAAAGDKLIMQGNLDDLTSGKVEARFNLDQAALKQLPVSEKGKKTTIAGATLTIAFGSVTFTGVADSKGNITDPFKAKLAGNSGMLQLHATDIAPSAVLTLPTTDGTGSAPVHLTITVTPVGGTAITVYDKDLTVNYSIKKGKFKGKI
jgi:hypothetical protein